LYCSVPLKRAKTLRNKKHSKTPTFLQIKKTPGREFLYRKRIHVRRKDDVW